VLPVIATKKPNIIMENTTNIFKILSKDDKELVHSAFLSFLIQNFQEVRNDLLGEDDSEINEPMLEVPYSYEINSPQKKGRKRIRFDIQIDNKEKNKTWIIENKFKSLPTVKQLNDYSTFIKNHFKNREIKKILISFSDCTKTIFPSDWEIITYEKIIDTIKKIKYFPNQKYKIYVDDYCEFLQDYISEFKENHKNENLKELFTHPTNKNNRFWLRLIFSELMMKLHKYDKFDVFHIDLGKSSTPLINIHSNFMWRNEKDNYEYLIQLQGKELKFYCHFWNGKKGWEIVSNEIEQLESANFKIKDSGKFKKKTTKKEKSMYIYKENILEEIPRESFDLEHIEKYILDFYERLKKATNR